MRQLRILLFLLSVLIASAPAASAATLEILPEQTVLRGPESRQQLLAMGHFGGRSQDWTQQAEWSSSNPAVAAVDDTGLVRPAGNGEALITARYEDLSASVKVRVEGVEDEFTWSFRNHVIPVLTKQGCNQGACHGAQAGKNGFKLSLRGYDPATDYDTLTREAVARRVSLADPESSLMLLKPTMQIGHGGGQRLEKGSLEYRVIAEWIAAGAPPPGPAEPSVTGLRVYPKEATLAKGDMQQIAVRAEYSDGTDADVTRWAKYNSTAEGVASVDDQGRVTMKGHGEAAITVWYSNKVVYARLTVPYGNEVSEADYEHFKAVNEIDRLVLKKLKQLNVVPSRRAPDSAFLRRAFLDATGTLPAAAETEEFLADDSPDKRARLIDELLGRDEYVDYWTYKWSDLLLLSSKKLDKVAVWDFYNWIRDSVAENKPWDEFARDIFTSAGSTRGNGALNYFVLHKDPIDLAENTTQAFLGQRLTCARCHNHPLEKWTQTQYYRFANLFTRVGIKDGDQQGERVIFAKRMGDINHPRLLRPMPPTPLDGQPLDLNEQGRRRHFAEWLTSPGNSYFAKNIVSRVWANFFARGLVEPEDNLSATNPPSNEALFDWLVEDFIAHGYDVKHLIRRIMNSAAYQRSSTPNATNGNDEVFYSKYIVKRLPAEVILDAVSQVTGVPGEFPGYPKGMRAIELPDVRVESQFLEAFGRPERIVCDVKERSSEPNIAQALHVVNGETLNGKLRHENSNAGLFLKLGLSEARIIEHLFLSAFSRYPSEQEKRQLVEALKSARLEEGTEEARLRARREAVEDMMWAILTSKEFLFNH